MQSLYTASRCDALLFQKQCELLTAAIALKNCNMLYLQWPRTAFVVATIPVIDATPVLQLQRQKILLHIDQHLCFEKLNKCAPMYFVANILNMHFPMATVALKCSDCYFH